MDSKKTEGEAFGDAEGDEEGGVDISLGNVMRVMLFTHKKESQDREQLIRIADTLDNLTKRLDHIENVIDPHSTSGQKQRRKSSRNPFKYFYYFKFFNS